MNTGATNESFAKTVLWELSVLRSQMVMLQSEALLAIASRTGRPMEEIRPDLQKRIEVDAERYFQQALKSAGLEDLPGQSRNGW